ncbi:BTAD domain-containing putative transcriptional regulator [Streptomyces sp. NPDC002018]|uniref:AfsR/SARP family transcriptional regulator n=1 Tax=Streptomyces sp. NPDC002018 TaxID=3364629 RepID=UPI00368B0464
MSRGLSFTVLGPVTARRHGVELALGSPQQKALLAALLLHEGAPMSIDEIADALWGNDVPATVAGVVRTYVYRLRRALGDGAGAPVIRSGFGGYELPLEPGELDLGVFRRHAAEAESARRSGAAGRVVAELRAALDLFPGTPLAGLPGPYAERQRDALDRMRSSARNALLQAELDRGGHAFVVDELTALVADRPFDERLREMQMVALYRCGRQAEALSAYQEARRVLADELGVDPGVGLRTLHERVLKADPELAVAPSVDEELVSRPVPAPATAQLPPDLSVFSGRAEHLREAVRLHARPRTGPGPTIGLVTGTAGVGKTIFAVHWAHAVADDFPDGQVYVNLRGFDPTGTPTPPDEAVRVVLQSLGVAADRLPAHLDAQHALYRSTLAGRRLILLLDNARDAQQLRPLLAGGPGCLVIVTSRAQLGGIVAVDGAHPIHLDLLTKAEAVDLLRRRLGDQRMAAEPQAVRELVRLCAGLPLALALVAARTASRRDFKLRDIAAEVSGGGLDALGAGDPASDARSVFSASYAALSEPSARVFRLLALHPGPGITVAAAAALADVPHRTARHALRELAEAVLLLEERRPGRYCWHDLLQAYAGEIDTGIDRADRWNAARRRFFDQLLRSTMNAASVLDPSRTRYTPGLPVGEVVAEHPADYAAALAWTAREHRVLLAAVTAAATTGFPHHAWHLARELETFQMRVGDWTEMTMVQRVALQCAQDVGDVVMQAGAHHSLAKAQQLLGDHEAAYAAAAAATGEYQAAEHRRGEADALGSLGDAAASLKQFERAVRHYEAGIALHHELGDLLEMSALRNSLALVLIETGDFDRASAVCQEALAGFEAVRDEQGTARTHETLALVRSRKGRPEASLPALRPAPTSFAEPEVTYLVAESFAYVGDAHAAKGDTAAALDSWQRASDLLAELTAPEAVALRQRVSGWTAAAGRLPNSTAHHGS